MRALDDAVRSGKVLYVGISDAPAWVVSRANTLAEWRGWSPFAALQVPYSLLSRDAERELLPMAETLGMSVAAWSPLHNGVLSGKYTRPGGVAPARRPALLPRGDRGTRTDGGRSGPVGGRRTRRLPGPGGHRLDHGPLPHRPPHHRRPPCHPAHRQPGREQLTLPDHVLTGLEEATAFRTASRQTSSTRHRAGSTAPRATE